MKKSTRLLVGLLGAFWMVTGAGAASGPSAQAEVKRPKPRAECFTNRNLACWRDAHPSSGGPGLRLSANFGPRCNIKITLVDGEVSGIGGDPKSKQGGFGIAPLPKEWNSQLDELFMNFSCEQADDPQFNYLPLRFDERQGRWMKDTTELMHRFAEASEIDRPLISQEIEDTEVIHLEAVNRAGWVLIDRDVNGEEWARQKRLNFCLYNPPAALCGGGRISYVREGDRGDLTPHVLKILRSIEFQPDEPEAPAVPASAANGPSTPGP